MSIELGRRLIAAGAVHPSEIEAGFYRQLVAGIPFVRAMLELGHVTEEVLEQELAASMAPFLATIVPLPALVDELPNQMCRRLLAVPVRRDPRTGLIDVAAVDPFDPHIPYEFSYHLKSEVRILRGPLVAIEQALARMDRGEYTASVILRKSVRPADYATPSVPPARSDRPIPLVRKAKRAKPVEVHPVHDITDEPRAHGHGRSDFSSGQVPPAPSVPSFGEGRPAPGQRARQQTSPGPPGVPARHRPPAPAVTRALPEVPSPVAGQGRPEFPSGPPPEARARPEVPSGAPSRGRPEVPTGAIPSARSRPEVPSGSPPASRSRPEVPGVAIGRLEKIEKPAASKGLAVSTPPTSSVSSASGAPGGTKRRVESTGGPPPAPSKVPTPASAGAGAKARVQSVRAPAAAAPVATSPTAVSKPPATSSRARSESGSAPVPARAGQSTKTRSSAPPQTTRGPFSPKGPVAPFADIRGVLAAMETATTRDDVIDCLIVGMSTVARRVGVFAVKKGHYRGVACNTELGDPGRFRTIEISAEATTVLGIAATSGTYLGPLPVTKPHQDLLAFMKDVSKEIAASLIRVAGRPAVILFADGLGDTTIATRRAEELGHEASLAFSRILTDAKASKERG